MRLSLRFVLASALAASVLVMVTGCGGSVAAKDTGKAPAAETEKDAGPLKVALGGIITPKSGVAYYNELLDYLSKKVGRPIELLDEQDYTAINSLLEKREADLGFVCSGPYTDAHAAWKMELLAAPQVKGSTVYYSYFIVNKDSKAASLKDLRGKSFAFTDPKSNTGKIVPTYVLAKMGETPEKFFKSTFFSKGHDQSIKAVATGAADGAAVDSLIWEYMNATDPTYTSKTKIIFKSDAFGIPPVVVHPSMDPKLKGDLQAAFLGMAADPSGAAILKKMNIEKWVEIDDSAYDSVREMTKWLSANQSK